MMEEFPFQKAHDAIVSMLHDYLAEKEHAERMASENAILMRETVELMAKVERLTKAGDAMADRLMYQGYPATVPKWNAAKEGKGQS